MRLIHLPTFWTILIDIIAWFIIHLGVVYFMVRIPAERFDPQSRLFRIRNWEKKGIFYQKYFRIKKWKAYLPDGAPFLGNRGFPKKELREKPLPTCGPFCLKPAGQSSPIGSPWPLRLSFSYGIPPGWVSS